MKNRITHDLAGKMINVDVYQKAGVTPVRAIVVAYGTEGMKSPFDALIDSFCDAMAEEGYLTVLPYYFESTGTAAGLAGVSADLDQTDVWIDTLAAAAAWMSGKFTSGKVGLVGFSLGANQILNAALKSPVAAVVDYYGCVDQFGVGPLPVAAQLTKPRVKVLPPTLIHHGNVDFIVRDSQSSKLKGWLNDHGIASTYYNDYDCGHPGQPERGWSPAAQKASTQRTSKFLSVEL